MYVHETNFGVMVFPPYDTVCFPEREVKALHFAAGCRGFLAVLGDAAKMINR